jgi:hypothetical protein
VRQWPNFHRDVLASILGPLAGAIVRCKEENLVFNKLQSHLPEFYPEIDAGWANILWEKGGAVGASSKVAVELTQWNF